MPQNIDLSLTPADNARLANLCGALDENILHIARALSVKIKRRGGDFRISGAPDSTERAVAALQALYRRANQTIVSDDVRLQLAQSQQPGAAVIPAEPPPAAAGGLRMRSAAQQAYRDKIHDYDITLCLGPAGTGKTHIAVVAALELSCGGARRETRRLILSRPAVEAGGERLGFLPGDMEQKVNPYLRPLYDILYQLLGRQSLERSMASGEIEVLPLAFMRGITLNNTILIVDEAQNTTPTQMKMLLTRLGHNSKIIVAGDITQADIAAGTVSGLSDAAVRLAAVRGIAIHHFHEADIVRHPVVRDILTAYEN